MIFSTTKDETVTAHYPVQERPEAIQASARLLSELKVLLELLINEQQIPEEYFPHPLVGNYKGCLECHIESDFLLIWIDDQRDIIELVRLGTHSELFGK